MKTLLGVTLAACGLAIAVSAQAQIKERTLRFATVNPPGHPIVAGMEKFAAVVNQKSGGKITVKLFPGSQLGGDVEVLASVQGGTIDITSMNSGILQNQVKEFAIVDFPFLFDNGKEADAVMDGPVGKELAEKLPAKGLVNLAYWELGFRDLTDSKRPVTKLSDIEGLKLRVIQSPIYVDTWKALGANPVPMAFPEVYSGLEQKTIDGQENPVTVILANKFNEVQKYLALTHHVYNPQSVLMSKKTWDSLSKQEQDIITAAAKEATAYQREFSREASGKALAELKKTMTVTEIAPTEMAKIRAAVKPVVDKYTADVGPALVKQLYAEIDKARGK
ncbi:MAG TPA: TRAP transporter substrate-binding protein [Casimicrobiaceae bacterium]|nr:TRAP transporter substrate-binding protein [Casimicrobiaceae bacterium]